jgi:hypothetical protein
MCAAKHDSFIRLPLSEDLKLVPGVGTYGVQSLYAVGITNTWQLISKYMSFGPHNTVAFLQWLSQFTTLSKHKETIAKAIAEKVAISFGLF